MPLISRVLTLNLALIQDTQKGTYRTLRRKKVG